MKTHYTPDPLVEGTLISKSPHLKLVPADGYISLCGLNGKTQWRSTNIVREVTCVECLRILAL